MPTVARQLQCVVRWGVAYASGPRRPAPRAPGGPRTSPTSGPAPRLCGRPPPPQHVGTTSHLPPPRGPPNAGRQAPLIAAARYERRLLAVACTPWLGAFSKEPSASLSLFQTPNLTRSLRLFLLAVRFGVGFVLSFVVCSVIDIVVDFIYGLVIGFVICLTASQQSGCVN